ncbi:AMP-dependent synthetase [Nocardioides szechwanensis]|uniref:Acyl-CoA synthetase n=1 Tax=Nocardioides szechwanensis TaxID=1005944 RepID=A0A1H0I5C3_9ACTN|nr:long-chain fatty acid--CoA ligase [Nocardioides szechwanensis]GEP34400.1 AMP-dependent synthetase [Nocardioides szechwanensis]SDO26615.1 long-chain acyl-CoA synthetase [Nocardioides szechwanensis]
MPVNHDTTFVDNLPQNMAVQFLDRVAASPQSEAFRYPVGEAWESLTWQQAGDKVRSLSAGLLSLGIESEQRIGIASGTRYEWILADLAVVCSGAATTTVYPTTNAEDTAYILGDSECRMVFAEDDEQIAKLKEHKSSLPHLEKVITFDGTADGDWIITLDALTELGDAYLAEHPDAIETVAKSIRPEQLATLIYTSGTTGRPKGVRLTHKAWVYEGAAIQVQDILDESDLQFLWLPMSHSFGKVLLSAQLACGFASAIDGRVEKIVENCGIVKPTFMGAAPRIFEKAYGRIQTMQAAEGGAKEKIFNKAFEVGLKVEALKRDGKSVPALLKLQHGLFDKLVFSKVRERFGGRVRFFISGSAALNQEIAEWFNAAGIVILEGYGMTENSAGATVNHPDENKIGTVGRALPGSEVRIGEGDEVLLRGPHVMDGYHNLPEETAKTLTDDGWLRTGDKGSLDADGFLTITGRIKDLFKTSGGKYIAPSAIESKFKAVCPYASQFMVFGNDRNFVVALITLDPDAMTGWAEENGMAGASYSDIVTSEKVHDMVGGYVEELNSRLNRWETIKKWEILDHDLTIESGELTPSMKVKRNVVEDNNKERIAAFYS